jgi:uncharacterized protein YcbK (DUF882 family)
MLVAGSSALGVAAWAGTVGDVVVAAAPGRLPSGYSDMVRRWHQPPPRPPELTALGRPMLVLEIINTNERLELSPLRDDGGFSQPDLERANYALRDHKTDDRCQMDARVLDLAYQLEVHFASRSLRIVSAFRASSPRSNHGKGRALDLVVPGAQDQEVARFAETLGFVGVGLYPVSGFIHVDSRPRSYFWIDRSGPGQRTKAVPVLPLLAQSSDRRAMVRGEAPPEETEPAEEQTAAQSRESAQGSRLGE